MARHRSNDWQRKLDFLFGVALLALLSPLQWRKRLLPAEIRRIGVLQPTAIGDLVLSSGLLAGLAARYPAAKIILFHGFSNAEATALLPMPIAFHRCDFQTPLRTIRMLRRAALDVLIDLTPWPRVTALCAFFAASRYTIGYRSAGQFRHWLFDCAVEHSSTRHEVDNLRAIGRVFDPVFNDLPRLRSDYSAPALPRGLELERLVLFHPWAGGARADAKRWPERYWVELARSLVRRGFQIGVNGSMDDVEHTDALLARFAVGPQDAFSLAARLDLVGLAYVLQRARLLVTVDTGVMHIAALLGGPLLALHGPSAPERWGPYPAAGRSISSPHPASGYIDLGFEDHPQAMEIMAALRPELVEAAALRIVNGRSGDIDWKR